MSDARLPHVLVLGAGIVGLTSALALAERGSRVTILERGAEVASGASAGNGAQLSYTYTDSLASPEILRELPSLLLGLDRAFRLGGTFDRDLLRWGWAFLRQCTAGRAAESTLRTLEIALESRLALHRFLERHPVEFDYARRGKLHLFYDAAAVAAAGAVAAQKRARGASQRVISAHEARQIEPALEGLAPSLQGALYAADDECGDCARFCQALLPILAQHYGVRFYPGTEVTSLEFDGHAVRGARSGSALWEADETLVCLGWEAPCLLRTVGIDLPLCPSRGYSLTWEAGAAAPLVSVTDRSRRIVFGRLGSRLRVAGFAELGGGSGPPAPARLAALVSAAREVLPGAADYDAAPLERWAGLRPMSPSGIPVTGRTRVPGLAVNVGHGMLGWTLAFGSAQRLADSLAPRD